MRFVLGRRVAGKLIASVVLGSSASAGDLVNSGFEPGQTWNGSSYVVTAGWPSSFRGGYALHARNSLEAKRWPVTGSFSETLLAARFQFRVESDNLSFDPDHDGVPFEMITLLGVLPKDGAGKRPNVAIKRDDDALILRVEDYGGFEFLYDAVVSPDRWHVLDVLFDQNNTRFAVALDGVTVHDDKEADLGTGTPFTAIELGIVWSTRNGHSLWFDNVRIRDSGGLQGPELDATATATPGVGLVPLTTSFVLNTSASSPTIEWDFEGDGVFDATGASVSKKYVNTGFYQPVARVTSGSARAAVYPPMVHVFGPAAPAITLQVDGGGDPTLPFPRVFDFRAEVTPSSGTKVTKVEFDWAGEGVHRWNARTLWKDGKKITVRMPHEFKFDTTEAVVRARAYDDAGHVSSEEIVVSLPVGPGDQTPPPRDARSGLYTTYGWKEVYVNRGNKLPSWVAGADVGAYLEWAVVEPSDNVFDFGAIDGSEPFTYNGQIHKIIKSGKNVVLHHRAIFPSWLFNKVGKSKVKNPEGYYYPQFWDPRYLPYVQRFVKAQADNLKALLAANPSWAGRFVLSRGQWLAVDSELLPTGRMPVVAFRGTSSEMDLTDTNFTAPSSGAYTVDFSPELAEVYAANLHAIYREAFTPLGVPSVFKPNSGGWYNGWDNVQADAEYRKSICNQHQGFFITNARADTGQDNWFLGYTDRGLAEGFHELGGNNTSVPNDTTQWQYWTLLSELNCGSEFPSTQGDFVWHLEYQAEYESEPLHEFVNRHAGWKPHPTLAPAAWIALKEPTTPPGEKFSTDDYGAFLTELSDDGFHVRDVGSVSYTYTGPTNLGHPPTRSEAMLWARTCPAGGRLNFAIDDAYRDAQGNSFDLEIVYHDSYQGVFFVRCKNQRGMLKYFFVPMTGDGKWHRAVVPLNSVELRDDLGSGVDFAIEADAQATTFHRLVLTPQ